MKILSMTATFGKLEHETLTLKPGLNIITAPNEWGKSTWCAFLVAMLYGIETRQHTTKAVLADKERYAPWSGKPMSGRMDILWQGRAITLERSTKGRTPLGVFQAYETGTGLPVAELTAENCGQTLLGVEKEVFLRGGFLRLNDLPLTQNEDLRRRLNALVTTGDERGDGERLAQKLNKLKNEIWVNRSKGLLPQVRQQLEAVQQKLQQLAELKEELAALQEAEGKLRAQQTQVSARLEQQLPQSPMPLCPVPGCNDPDAAEAQVKRLLCERARLAALLEKKQFPLWTVGLVLLALAPFVYTVHKIGALALALLGLGTVVVGLVLGANSRSEKDRARQQLSQLVIPPPEVMAAYRRDFWAYRSGLLALQDTVQTRRALEACTEERSRLQLRMGSCQGQMTALGSEEDLHHQEQTLLRRCEELETTYSAVILAQNTLAEATAQLQKRFAPRISRRAKQLLGSLTGGRYDRLNLTDELRLEVGAEDEDILRSPLWRSDGTADQLYLAVRLAVAEELTPHAPLVLDDALVRFDDARLTAALEVLREQAEEKQILLFTCQGREQAILGGLEHGNTE